MLVGFAVSSRVLRQSQQALFKPVASNLNMTLKTTLILIFIPFIAISQQFEKVDLFAENITYDKEQTINELTERLTSPFSDDIDKVRAIYYWITKNIDYDYENYNNNSVTEDQGRPEIVLQNKMAVCSGYSNLFKSMVEFCNIECEVITGYARNNLETIFVNEPNHAWNAVKLVDRWYLFDVTWARDTVNKGVDNFYFQSNPEVFFLNHFPIEYKWSLIEKQYSFEDFMKFPVFTNLFYDLKFTEEISTQGYFKTQNDTVTIDIRPRIECIILTKHYDFAKREWIKSDSDNYKRTDDSIKLYLPEIGKYLVKVGALLQDDNSYTIYDPIIYYLVENK
jgi:transglutaminase/protease-like cytokinesis protein 3